jgi:hypothetical protein
MMKEIKEVEAQRIKSRRKFFRPKRAIIKSPSGKR